jgi:hypothetical protein
MIRPVTEIAGRISVAVHEFKSDGAHQLLIHFAVADEPAGCAIGLGAVVVDLAQAKAAASATMPSISGAAN